MATETIAQLPNVSTVSPADLLIKWDGTQVSGQQTQSIQVSAFLGYLSGALPQYQLNSTINVTTLPPGSAATASLSGTFPIQTLSLGIPAGTPGMNGTGSGSVTSVGLALPADFTVSGSPVTVSGTLTATRTAQAANAVFAGPTSGGNAVPTYRALVSADLPASAALTGTPTTPTATAGTNTTQIASTAFANASATAAVANYAPLASPALTGTPTAPTAAAGTNTTQLATMAALQTALGSVGGGFPTAFSTKSANYPVLTTDKNTQFNLTGLATLTLPSASSFGAGNGIYLTKTDGLGFWTVTPASGTIEGLSSITVYQEKLALVSDGTNWRSPNRQKGWIDCGLFTVASGTSSLTATLGFGDAEIRSVEMEILSFFPSASANLNLSLLVGGSAVATVGEAVTASATAVSSASLASTTSQTIAVGNSSIYYYGKIVFQNINSAVASAIAAFSEIYGSTYKRSTGINVGTASGPLSGITLAPASGTFAFQYATRVYRP